MNTINYLPVNFKVTLLLSGNVSDDETSTFSLKSTDQA